MASALTNQVSSRCLLDLIGWSSLRQALLPDNFLIRAASSGEIAPHNHHISAVLGLLTTCHRVEPCIPLFVCLLSPQY